MNKKILASLIIIGILGFALGWGTYSYFSDTETSTGNTFTAGTMDLKLSNDGTTWTDGVTATWTSPSNWAPGETVTARLHIKNEGSIGAYWLYIGIKTPVTGELCSQIIITEFVIEEYWGGYNHIDWMATSYGPWDTNGDGKLTLAEFAQYAGTDHPYGFMANGDEWTGTYDPSAPKILPAGADITLRMTFLFNPDAGNEYQGKSCSFDLTVSIWNGYPGAYTQVGGGSPNYAYGY